MCVCVCVCCWVNRNRKWVFSYVVQRLVPTHAEGRGHWPSVLRLILFLEDVYKTDSQVFILTPVIRELKWIYENGCGRDVCLGSNLDSLVLVELLAAGCRRGWVFHDFLQPSHQIQFSCLKTTPSRPQPVSRRRFAAEGQIRFHANECRNCGGHTGMETSFSNSFSRVFPFSFIRPMLHTSPTSDADSF